MNHFLRDLSQILNSPSKSSPKNVRSQVLQCLGKGIGAEWGLLAPAEKGLLRIEEGASWGDPPDWKVGARLLNEALRADSGGGGLSPKPNSGCRLFRLSWSGRSLGALGLGGGRLQLEEPPGVSWEGVIALLSMWEHNGRLGRLLSVSERRLRLLTSDSRDIAERNERLFTQLMVNQDRLRSISKGVIRMQEEERSKISRELHDGVGQSLTALKINLDLVAAETRSQLSESGRRRLDETRKLASNSIEEVRELSRLLRPRMLDELGLSPTLRWLTRSFAARTGMEVTVQENVHDRRLEADLETLLFRVVQEGLNNIVKHAESKTARIRLDLQPQRVLLEVSDRGKGIDGNPLRGVASGGSGLHGIRDRVSLAGGKFDVKSQAGRGTTLRLEIPLEKQSNGSGAAETSQL